VEHALAGKQYRKLLKTMYGNDPAEWRDDLGTTARQRFVINTMTRLRTLDSNNAQVHHYKGTLADMPADLSPWFMRPTVRRARRKIIAGHWSALGLHKYHGHTDLINIDTGCIWGRTLTAYRLEDGSVFQQPSVEVEHSTA
jgi:bis(5'-nucleosyl)-tetraphosphatase (symmetrical)